MNVIHLERSLHESIHTRSSTESLHLFCFDIESFVDDNHEGRLADRGLCGYCGPKIIYIPLGPKSWNLYWLSSKWPSFPLALHEVVAFAHVLFKEPLGLT